MNQTENKPKLADIARQNNAAKASKFSAAMVPPPPLPKEEDTQAPMVKSLPEDASKVEATEAEGLTDTASVVPAPAAPAGQTEPTRPTQPAPIKANRTRRSPITIDDVISPQPPKGEPYPRQVRIADSHHELLRQVAFKHRKTMNHVLFNLLELLDQAYQRENTKGD